MGWRTDERYNVPIRGYKASEGQVLCTACYYICRGDYYADKNKRVNLTLPDAVYERLQKNKEKNGITSDAGACAMLIVRRLDAIEESEKMMDMMSRFSLEELQKLSNMGLAMIQQEKTNSND